MKEPALRGIVPLVPALDMEKSISFYVNELGFSTLFTDCEHPVAYAGLKRDDVELHLYKTDNRTLCDWAVIRLWTDRIEALYERYRTAEYLHPNGKLERKPYGLTEFSLLDPSGVLITFFQ